MSDTGAVVREETSSDRGERRRRRRAPPASPRPPPATRSRRPRAPPPAPPPTDVTQWASQSLPMQQPPPICVSVADCGNGEETPGVRGRRRRDRVAPTGGGRPGRPAGAARPGRRRRAGAVVVGLGWRAVGGASPGGDTEAATRVNECSAAPDRCRVADARELAGTVPLYCPNHYPTRQGTPCSDWARR